MRMTKTKRMIMTATGSSLLLALAGAASAEPLSLESLQHALKQSPAGWVAGPTSISALPRDSWRRMLGVPLSSIHRSPFTVNHRPPLSAPLPTSFDWRNVDGLNYVSPILDQGQCGSCVAFATIGTFETQLNIANKTSASPFQLSPQYLFSCGGGGCGFGWDVDPAMQFLVQTGVPDDACLPYSSGANGADAECSAACADVSNRAVTANDYTRVGSSITSVKRALLAGPLAATMTVYDDFMFYKSGVYKHVTGSVAGGHAVSIIGWSDADRAWIVRNSWGTGWGMNGFFEIAYDDDSGVGAETWGVKVAPAASYVSIGLRDGAVLSGVQDLKFMTSGVSSPVTWTLAQGGANIANGASPDAKSSSVDSTKFPDGVYTITPHAGAVTGEPRIVYVLNGKEAGAVNITSQTDGQTLSGIVTITFTTRAHPVPLTRVTFVVTDKSGHAALSRATEDTGDEMQVGWNTADVPNGDYTLTISGFAGTQPVTAAKAAISVAN